MKCDDRSIVCLTPFLLNFIFCFPGFSQDTLTRSEKSQELFYLLADDILGSDYFLNEFDILDYQKQRLAETITENSATFAKLLTTGGANTNPSNAISEILEKLEKEINSILLPHQSKAMTGKISQRAHQKKFGCEAVDLVFIVLDQLNLPEEQKELFLNEGKEIRQSYHKKIAELREEAKTKCLGLLPENDLNRLAVYSAISKGSESKAKYLPSNTLEVVIRERNFDQLEKLIYAEFVYDLRTNQFARDLLLFGPSQVEALEESLRQLTSQTHTVSGPTDDERAEFLRLGVAGDVDGLKRLHEKQLLKQADRFLEQANLVGGQVLTKPQDRIAREYAQLRAESLKAGNDDLFGLISASVLLMDSGNKPAIKRVIEETRASFYKKRLELLKDAFDKLINAIPEPGKSNFIGLFGTEVYDFESEKLFKKK